MFISKAAAVTTRFLAELIRYFGVMHIARVGSGSEFGGDFAASVQHKVSYGMCNCHTIVVGMARWNEQITVYKHCFVDYCYMLPILALWTCT